MPMINEQIEKWEDNRDLLSEIAEGVDEYTKKAAFKKKLNEFIDFSTDIASAYDSLGIAHHNANGFGVVRFNAEERVRRMAIELIKLM